MGNTFASSQLILSVDYQTFRTIHRYGAILSVLAIVGAVLAIVIGGPLAPLVLPLGFFGPLAGFYFIGAVLEEYPAYRILGEELMRGVVWYGGSLLGWAFILTESTTIPTTSATTMGLPPVTALALSLIMVGIRRTTGLDLKVQTEGGQLLVLVTGGFVGGFIVLYLVLVGGRSPLLAAVYVLATGAGLFIWRRNRHRITEQSNIDRN
jgi:hypothetical protein